MNIILNNRPESFEQNSLTINQLLQVMNYSYKMLIVKVNSELVKTEEYESVQVKDGDKVEVLHLMTGG